MMYGERSPRAYNECNGCGLTRDDIVLLTCTMDRCFIAGLAYFSGRAEPRRGRDQNRLSGFESHLEIIERLKPTAIVGVRHSCSNWDSSEIAEHRPRATGVSRLICIGEP
jgi:phenylacetate-CoA ligase